MKEFFRAIWRRTTGILDISVPYTRRQFRKQIRDNGFQIGAETYGRVKLRWWGDDARLIIGDYCAFANIEIFLGGAHRTDWSSIYPFPAFPKRWPEASGVKGYIATRGDVTIGSDVWIASRAMIMSGVTIGHGAVVAARSVVTHDVPPYAIVAGVPARIVGYRFTPDIIERFLAVAWWDWDRDRLAQLLPLLLSDKIEDFLQAAEAARAPAVATS